jgi:WD40 repeat protein
VQFIGTADQVVTASGDNRVRIVALDGKEVRALPEVADFMQSAAASADGKIVVAGGQDGILRLWNTTDGKPLGAFKK